MNNSPGVRDYTLLAMAGLLIIMVLLVDEGLGWWAVLPLACGTMGVMLPGTVAVPFVLLVLLVLLGGKGWFAGWAFERIPDSPLSVLLFAVAVFVYVAGHTRLLTIRRHAVPPDTRREKKPGHDRLTGRWLLPAEPTKRSVSLLPEGEFWVLAASVPIFVLVAYLLWLTVALEPVPDMIDIRPQLWRALVILWAGVIGLAGVYTLTSYLGRVHASREESLMYLQDQLWAATRGELRRINSWRAWSRLRRERKEQTP